MNTTRKFERGVDRIGDLAPVLPEQYRAHRPDGDRPGVEKPARLIDRVASEFAHKSKRNFFVEPPIEGLLAFGVRRDSPPALFVVPLRPGHDLLTQSA